jgi:hypothetical protein
MVCNRVCNRVVTKKGIGYCLAIFYKSETTPLSFTAVRDRLLSGDSYVVCTAYTYLMVCNLVCNRVITEKGIGYRLAIFEYERVTPLI